jgi:hypothetical protein
LSFADEQDKKEFDEKQAKLQKKVKKTQEALIVLQSKLEEKSLETTKVIEEKVTGFFL